MPMAMMARLWIMESIAGNAAALLKMNYGDKQAPLSVIDMYTRMLRED